MTNTKKIEIQINNLKSIKSLTLKLNLKPGLICIVGGNGSGKTTILSVISQLIEKSDINKIFFDERRIDSNIKIKIDTEESEWQRTADRWIRTGNHSEIKGFYESGIVYGSRFLNSSLKTINKYCEHYAGESSHYIEASEFIYKNLGKILKGNENHYKGLKTITKSSLREKARTIEKEAENFLIRAERPFLMLKDSGYITQYKMSSGEYLMLKILDYIYFRITYTNDKKQEKTPFLVIIDEVEIALHPAAQKRLIQFCNKVSKEHGICIIFSTHSREVINSLKPEQIFLLESHLGNISITTPCYPHYATRGIYESAGYDYIICVEDNLAKRIVQDTIKKKNLSNNKLVNVCALGGWREVLNFTREFKEGGLFNNTKMVIVLDGDMEENFHSEFGSPCRKCAYHDFVSKNHNNENLRELEPPKPDCKMLPNKYPYYHDVTFLPIASLEKELRSKLITNVDYDFISLLENKNFFGQSSVSDIVSQYEVSADHYFNSEDFKRKHEVADLKNYDSDGKKLWRLMERNLAFGTNIENLVSFVCDTLSKAPAKSIEAWSDFERRLEILLQKPVL